MQFQTPAVATLSGLTPVAGVYKLEAALQEIQGQLDTLSPSSVAHNEFESLQQQYTQHLDEAKQLRQRGMASFQKYLANKSGQSASVHQTNRPNVQNAPTNIANCNENNGNLANGNASTAARPTTQSTAEHKTVDDRGATQQNEQIVQLKQQNAKLLQQIESLMKSKSESEETEHELRVILEEYKFAQLSHKQEVNELKHSVLTYKKASAQKAAALEALTNEYETAKHNNTLMARQNTQLKQRITSYIEESTNLKQELIERRALCEQLQREKQELVQQLKLSQKLGHHSSRHNSDDANTVNAPSQSESQRSYDAAVASNLKPRIQKVCNMVADLPSDVDYTSDIQRELQDLLASMDTLPVVTSTANVATSTQTAAATAAATAATTSESTKPPNVDGNYVITEEEYRDIEKVIDDRDKYLSKVSFYEQSLSALRKQYEALQQRFGNINEEKSTMMSTLKQTVERLATENSALRGNMRGFNDEKYNMKESELKAQNEFYKAHEENREYKFEMEHMRASADRLAMDIQTYKYLSQQLKDNNNKLNENLREALQRVQTLCTDKQLISDKLREANQMNVQLMKERQKMYAASKTASDATGNSHGDNITTADVVDDDEKYDKLLQDKVEIQRLLDENDGTVHDLTNQVIELEHKVREFEIENELLRKEMSLVNADNAKQINQLKSAQRVALSIMSNMDGSNDKSLMNLAYPNHAPNKDIFGLQRPPEPDLMTSLLTYLLPFLFDDDDQPKIV